MSSGDAGRGVTVRTAALRLAGLAVAVVVLVIFRSPVTVAIGAAAVVTLALVTGLGIRSLLLSVRPLRWIAVIMIGFHVIIGRGTSTAWSDAVTFTGTLLVTVALAGHVTATTPASAILDAIERALGPLRHVGVDPARIALVFALALRSVPVLHQLATRTRDAARARGVERSVRAQIVPLVVSGLRHADRLGDALAARGADDPPDHDPPDGERPDSAEPNPTRIDDGHPGVG